MPVPQLRMGFTRFAELEQPQPRRGVGLRTFRSGDEDAWIDLLNTGDFGYWDRNRLDAMLEGERALLPRDGVFFATRDGRPVGCACVFLHQDTDTVVPELGWVVVHPAHRAHGLGSLVCRAALCFIRELGHQYVYLKTEDFRVPAIHMYLRLGFEPEMIDATHPKWWASFCGE